jgi:hypothetical protein
MRGHIKLGLFGLAFLWAALVGYVGIMAQESASLALEAKKSQATEDICGASPPQAKLKQANSSEVNR